MRGTTVLIAGESGGVGRPTAAALDEELRRQLWEERAELCGAAAA